MNVKVVEGRGGERAGWEGTVRDQIRPLENKLCGHRQGYYLWETMKKWWLVDILVWDRVDSLDCPRPQHLLASNSLLLALRYMPQQNIWSFVHYISLCILWKFSYLYIMCSYVVWEFNAWISRASMRATPYPSQYLPITYLYLLVLFLKSTESA